MDNEAVLRPSCLGADSDCGDRGDPSGEGGSIRGFAFSLGGSFGDEVRTGWPSISADSLRPFTIDTCTRCFNVELSIDRRRSYYLFLWTISYFSCC